MSTATATSVDEVVTKTPSEEAFDAYRETLDVERTAKTLGITMIEAFTRIKDYFAELNADAIVEAYEKAGRSIVGAAKALNMDAGEAADILDSYIPFLYNGEGRLNRKEYAELRNARIVEVWNEGHLTQVELGEHFNLSKARVLGILHEARQKNPDAIFDPGRGRRVTGAIQDRNKLILNLLKSGMSVPEVAEEMNLTEGTISNVLYKKGPQRDTNKASKSKGDQEIGVDEVANKPKDNVDASDAAKPVEDSAPTPEPEKAESEKAAEPAKKSKGKGKGKKPRNRTRRRNQVRANKG